MQNRSKSENFNSVIDFYLNFKKESRGVWKDQYGEYTLSIGRNLLHQNLQVIKEYQVLCLQKDRELLGNDYREDEQNKSLFISVGSFKMHNLARKLCIKERREFISVPILLANDSFGTNRLNIEGKRQSVQSVFPVATIFDLDLLETSYIFDNLLGLGEFSGLYVSILDYYQAREKPVPNELLGFIAEQVNKYLTKAIDCNENRYEKFLVSLSEDLTFKCLIMRANWDHQIGCGMDHLIGGVLERSLKIPHGQAVFLASIISVLFFPRFEKFGLTLGNLLKINEKYKILPLDLIERVTRMDPLKLIQQSINSRPNRMSKLKNLSASQIGVSWAKFDLYIS